MIIFSAIINEKMYVKSTRRDQKLLMMKVNVQIY